MQLEVGREASHRLAMRRATGILFTILLGFSLMEMLPGSRNFLVVELKPVEPNSKPGKSKNVK